MKTSPLRMKWCTLLPSLGTRGHWAVRVLYCVTRDIRLYGHLRGPVRFTPVGERLTLEPSIACLDDFIKFVVDGICACENCMFLLENMCIYVLSVSTYQIKTTIEKKRIGLLYLSVFVGYSLYLQKWPQLDSSVTSSYSLSVQCTDGTSTKTASHTVSVTVNSKPTISNLGIFYIFSM